MTETPAKHTDLAPVQPSSYPANTRISVPGIDVEIISAKLIYDTPLRSLRPNEWLMTLRVHISLATSVKLSGIWLVIDSNPLGPLQYLANSFKPTALQYSEIQTFHFNVAQEIADKLFDFRIVLSLEGIPQSVYSPIWTRINHFDREFAAIKDAGSQT
ncbi:MAG: hypothetical protein O2821_10665 [Chloroflexi bacterium]|nr:hypothetical protein [Chloroflexota bacterium]